LRQAQQLAHRDAPRCAVQGGEPTLGVLVLSTHANYDDTTRRRFIKLFAGAKYDILVIVRELADGSVLWNVMNRERAGMNALRVGEPIYRREGKE